MPVTNDTSLFVNNRSTLNSLVAYEDFLGGPSTIANNNQVGQFLRAVIVAPSTIASAAGVANHPGIKTCTVGAPAENAYLQSTSSIFPGVDPIALQGSVRVTAAAAGNDVALGIGLGFALPGAATARAQIIWQQTSNSWVCQTADGAASSSVVVPGQALNTWYDLKIVLNNTQAQFFIDGALVATITSTLPVAALAVYIQGLSASGTGTGTIDVDYLSVSQTGISR